jgi:hypothetical protein
MMFQQQAWAKEFFQLSSLPIKLVITDRKHNFYGQASVKRDKQERFEAFHLKISSFYVLRYEIHAYSEYASFNDHPEIGGFRTSNWRQWLETLIAHEMSHIVQFALKIAAYDAKAYGRDHPLVGSWDGSTPVFTHYGRYEGHHGDFFQSIYRAFRRTFINSMVKAEDYTVPRSNFLIPDDFEERMALMPRSGLEGIRFENNGRTLEVVGRNPNNNRLFGYQVKDPNGKFLRCKLSLIAYRSKEALARINSDPKLSREYRDHILAMQSKSRANAKSSMVKQGAAKRRG